jgi:predicted esterase
MILVHGRGATAESILELASLLPQAGMASLAPQAVHNSWYPYSFMYPTEQNEPYLTSALARLGELVAEVEAAGIPAEKLVLAGFSQGACLAAEFAARNARRYGGLLLFSGGLIGPPGTPRDYAGSLDGTPVFIGCSDADFHIPLERVQETTATLRRMGAAVTEKIYPGLGHTIIGDEIEQARRLLRAVDSNQ